MKTRIVFIVLAMFGGIFSAASPSEALSCASPGPVLEEMERSAVVFKGKAVEIKDGGVAVFHVTQAWKGVEEPIFEINDNGGWDPFKLNTSYLVFGSEREGELRMNLCGNSGVWNPDREVAMHEADIPYILFDEPLQQEQNPPEHSKREIAVTVIVIGVVVFVGIIAVVWRKNRRVNT